MEVILLRVVPKDAKLAKFRSYPLNNYNLDPVLLNFVYKLQTLVLANCILRHLQRVTYTLCLIN